MQEKWKQYLDYDLEISNLGNIRKFTNKVMLKSSKDKDGYLWYMLKKSGKKDIKKFIHTMVLETFGESRPSLLSVCRHLDGNKNNNNINNLKWGTHLDNIYDRLDVYDSKIFLTRELIIKIKYDLSQLSREDLFLLGRG